MASDTKFLGDLMLNCSRGDSRLFRNSVGRGWVGKSSPISKAGMILARPGDVLISNARPLHAGLMKGSGDLIGWHTITITPEMVGRKVALFVSFEAKEGTGRSDADQVNWRNQVEQAGGIAAEIRSVEQAKEVLHYANSRGIVGTR